MGYAVRPITVEELQSIEFPVVHFKEGYAADEVNAFLGECVEALRGRSGLSADDVEHHIFSTTYKSGYNAGDVDLVLDRIAQTLRSRSNGKRTGVADSLGIPGAPAQPARRPAEGSLSDSASAGLAAASNGFLSKAWSDAEKFAKDNDLEGKLRLGRAKAQKAFAKAKDEAGRIAAEDSLEGKIAVMREQSDRAWSGIQSNKTVKKLTDHVQSAAHTVGSSVGEMRTAYEDRRAQREQEAEERRHQLYPDENEPPYGVPLISQADLDAGYNEPGYVGSDATADANRYGEPRTVPENGDSTRTMETAAGEQDSTAVLPDAGNDSAAEPIPTMPLPDMAVSSETADGGEAGDESDQPIAADAVSKGQRNGIPDAAVPAALHRPSEEKRKNERPSHAKTGANAMAGNVRALFADERNRPVLIGCIIALILLMGFVYCAFQPSKDSKEDETPASPSYSSVSDSEDESTYESSTPSFETIDTDSLKGDSVKDVVKELEEKGLTYGFLFEGGDGTDQSSTVKTSLEKGEEWTVVEARQSATDGEVTLTVQKKETPKPKEKKQEPQQPANDNGVITVANNQEFASLLAVKDPFDPSVAAFAEKYKGRTIEFDGNIAGTVPNEKHPRYRLDYMLVYGGDYSTESVSGPSFRFEGVMWSDFHDGSVGLPLYVREGHNVHIKATVGSYNPESGIFKLDLEKMTER